MQEPTSSTTLYILSFSFFPFKVGRTDHELNIYWIEKIGHRSCQGSVSQKSQSLRHMQALMLTCLFLRPITKNSEYIVQSQICVELSTCDWMAFLIFHILVANYLTRLFEFRPDLSQSMPFSTDIPNLTSSFTDFECDNILVYLGFQRSYLCLLVASH